jgi:aromatic ring-opening dioxygenase LigB subunit
MLVHASFIPYPLYNPNDASQKATLAKTFEALKKIHEELYASQPDEIIIISKHTNMLPDSFSATLCETLMASLQSQGNFEEKKPYRCSIDTLQSIKETIQGKSPFVLFTDTQVPLAASIALEEVVGITTAKITSLYYSDLDNQTHWDFGIHLREAIETSQKRVAVIAVGNLSHCVTLTLKALNLTNLYRIV